MERASGQTQPDLIGQLFAEPFRFDFFQAVRLLERAALLEDEHNLRPVGRDAMPRDEVVRFRALPSLTFPAGAIAEVAERPDRSDDNPTTPPDMTVAFMGLFGPSGVLPQHYTAMLIRRLHARHRDPTLRDFLDLFNHRSISFFFRAWEKYRFACGYERSGLVGKPGDDLFSFSLRCLAGLGEPGLRNRLDFSDEAVLFYGGHFAHSPRNARSLELLLADFFDARIDIEQFRGQWLYLSQDNQTSMPDRRHPEGRNLELGISTVVGSRVWDVQSRFRVRVGPLSYREFERFIPSGSQLLPLCQMTRLYAGRQYDFDVQLILKRDDVPPCRLGQTEAPDSRLGWNTWIANSDFEHDVNDAVFQPGDMPP